MKAQVFDLVSPSVRHNAAQALANAPDGYQAIIKPRTRRNSQNAMLHALFDVVAKRAKWCGRRLDADQWKVLFISGHAKATGGACDLVTGLEGELVNIRESSARMSVKRMSSLIEYVLAWCLMNGIPTARTQRKYGFMPPSLQRRRNVACNEPRFKVAKYA